MYHLTGNKDNCSYHYVITLNDNVKFRKTITINYEDNYDTYKESFCFPTYEFIVVKFISKINKSLINKKFLKKYECDLNNYNFCIRYIYKINLFNFIEPSLFAVSNKLFNLYTLYYEQLKNEKLYMQYVTFY